MAATSQTLVPRSPKPAHPFRRAVLRGVAVLCPPLLTILIVVWAVETTRSYLLEPVTSMARDGLAWYLADVREGLTPEPPGAKTAVADGETYRELANGTFIPQKVFERVERQPGKPTPRTAADYYRRYIDLTYLRPPIAVPLFVALLILLLYFLGKFMAANIGGFFVSTLERMVLHLPGVRTVYSAVKQVTDFFFSERELKFTRIVAVEHPRQGVWSLGFVTGESMTAVSDRTGEPMVTVLIPYSPLPVTGCTIMVPKSTCIDLNITFDQACQFIVSCGVVVPPSQIES